MTSTRLRNGPGFYFEIFHKKMLQGLEAVECFRRQRKLNTQPHKIMTFAADIYVDSKGNTYGAKDTDQAHTRHDGPRTVRGFPVEHAGKWFGSQMDYRPYKFAVKAAAKRLNERLQANAAA